MFSGDKQKSGYLADPLDLWGSCGLFCSSRVYYTISDALRSSLSGFVLVVCNCVPFPGSAVLWASGVI